MASIYETTSDTLRALPRYVKQRRESLGLTHREAAREIGVRASMLQHLENDTQVIGVPTVLRVLAWMERTRPL